MFKTAKHHVVYIGFSTALAAFSAGSIMAFTDPLRIGLVSLFFLYTSIFLTVLGLFTLLGLFIRQWLMSGMYVLNLSHSFRQALLISILVIASLILSSQGLLYWWVEGSLILFLLFFEIFLNLKV